MIRMPLLPKLWLILISGMVCAALIRRGVGLFDAGIIVMTAGSVVCLVLSP